MLYVNYLKYLNKEAEVYKIKEKEYYIEGDKFEILYTINYSGKYTFQFINK